MQRGLPALNPLRPDLPADMKDATGLALLWMKMSMRIRSVERPFTGTSLRALTLSLAVRIWSGCLLVVRGGLHSTGTERASWRLSQREDPLPERRRHLRQ